MSDFKDSMRKKRKYLASMILVLIPYLLYLIWLACKMATTVLGAVADDGGVYALLSIALKILPLACPVLSAISSVAGMARIKDLRANGIAVKNILILGIASLGMVAATVIIMVLRVKAAVS